MLRRPCRPVRQRCDPPTLDTLTTVTTLATASGPTKGVGYDPWSDGRGRLGKLDGDGGTEREESPPTSARPRRTGSDPGAVSLITLVSMIRFQRCLYHKIGAFNSKRAAKTA